MNKTVTANISGIVYHIDVDAYETLGAYLDKIRSYFKNAEECDEIMADIEARIAELFNERISSENQVISSKDVAEVIEVMGRPEQYVDTSTESQKEAPKSERTYARTAKRLFRDPDDRVLGGVASGIGSYLGLDPVWIRLLFIIFLFMGFGFLFYVILWIIIPEARTSAEKLQMRGEPVNIENLGKSFEDGASRVNEKIKNMDSNQIGKSIESFLQSFFSVLTTLLTGIFRVFGKLLGFAFVMLGIFLAVVFIGSLLQSNVIYAFTSNGIFSFESYDFFSALFSSKMQYNLASIGIIMFLGAPILGLLLGGIKLLFNIKGNTGIGIGLGVIWIIGMVLCVLIGIQLATEFKSEAEFQDIVQVNDDYDQLIISMDLDDIPGEQVINVEDDEFFLTMDKKSIYYGFPDLDIRKSKGDSAYIEVIKSSNGRSKKIAIDNAKSILYEIEQDDNLLIFDAFISIDKESGIRGQDIELILYIPEGKVIFLDQSSEELIFNIDNVSHTYDGDMIGENWIMLEDGLTCLDCDDIDGISADELEF